MPLGVVDDLVFDIEREKIEQRNELINSLVIDSNKLGRNGVKEVPESLRKVIGESAIEDGNKATKKAFDISMSSITAYKEGATSTATYNEPNPKLNDHMKMVRDKITGSARQKLNMALEHITDDKLANAKLKDVAVVAKAMSGIIKDMEPSDNRGDQLAVQIVFMSPHLRNESDFGVIEVNE